MRPKATIPLFFLSWTVLLAGGQSSCGRTDESGGRKNVILICLDTVRADHVGAYGYSRNPTTPTLDALAERSTLFSDTSATAGWTKPSVPSYMTGTYALQHGVYEGHSSDSEGEHSDVLPDGATTLAEVFQERGYQTAAFIQNAQIRKGQGIEQGFDLYVDKAGDAREIRWQAIDWLDDHEPSRPFFLYLHFLDAHWPYPVPDEYAELFSSEEAISLFRTRDWKQLRKSINDGETVLDDDQRQALIGLYDGALRYIDDQLARLLGGLERRGLNSETVICILADHGEEFLEHGKIGHGHGLHEELLQVPWILHVPDRTPAVVSTPVSLIDLFPTLLHAADVAAANETEGIDRLEDPSLPREGFAEHKAGRSYQQSLRQGDLKIIRRFKRQTVESEPQDAALDRLARESRRLSVELRKSENGVRVAREIKPRGEATDPMEIKGVIESVSESRIVINGVTIALARDVELYGATMDPSGAARILEPGLAVKAKVKGDGDSLEADKIKLYEPDPEFEPEVRGFGTAFERTESGGLLHLGAVVVAVDETTVIELGVAAAPRIAREDLRELLATPTALGSKYRRESRLYNLRLDPKELSPLEEHPGLHDLSAALDRLGIRLGERAVWSSSDRSALTAEEISDLEAIGYVGDEE